MVTAKKQPNISNSERPDTRRAMYVARRTWGNMASNSGQRRLPDNPMLQKLGEACSRVMYKHLLILNDTKPLSGPAPEPPSWPHLGLKMAIRASLHR